MRLLFLCIFDGSRDIVLLKMMKVEDYLKMP